MSVFYILNNDFVNFIKGLGFIQREGLLRDRQIYFTFKNKQIRLDYDENEISLIDGRGNLQEKSRSFHCNTIHNFIFYKDY